MNYTLDSFNAGRVLRRWPIPLRPIMVWILPEWRKIRQDVKDARRILAPVVNARLEKNRAADEKGVPRPKTNDTIQVSSPFSLCPFWISSLLPFSPLPSPTRG